LPTNAHFYQKTTRMNTFFRTFALCSALVISVCLSSCKKDETIDTAAIDAKNLADIRAYLKTNSLAADSTDTGLYYVITKQGTVDSPTATSTVTVRYVGKYLDGKEFDSSTSNISFSLQNVIKGWQQGIPKLKRGGKGTFLVPAKLGYGYSNYQDIPGGSVLVFDVELISF